jgi:hypothetical protein
MQVKAGIYWENQVCPLSFTRLGLLLCAVLFLMGGCATANTTDMVPANLPLLEKWSGDYPVSELGRLPEGQQDVRAGYIGDIATFIPVWRAFMPDEILPVVDFSKNIVVFTRNIQFYNRTSILKVTLQEINAEIFAMETMSAMPIEEKVAMAMAVIPRTGIIAIQSGTEKIQVMDYK